MSKSCEDLTRHQAEESNHVGNPTSNNIPHNNRSKSNRKFTFQSTIRQIERKRIAEKLSKDAEEKGTSRLVLFGIPIFKLILANLRRKKKTARTRSDEKSRRGIPEEKGTRKG